MNDPNNISDLVIFIMGLNNRLSDLVDKSKKETQIMNGIYYKIDGLIEKVMIIEDKLDKIDKALETQINSNINNKTVKCINDMKKSIDLIGPRDDGPFAHVVTDVLKRLFRGSDASEKYHGLRTIAQEIINSTRLDTTLTRTNKQIRGVIRVFESQSTSKQQEMVDLLEKKFYLEFNTSIASEESWFAKRIMQRNLFDVRRKQLNGEPTAADISLCLPTIEMENNTLSVYKTKLRRCTKNRELVINLASDSSSSDEMPVSSGDPYTTPKNDGKHFRGLAKCTGRGACNSTGRGRKKNMSRKSHKRIFWNTVPN